MLVEDDDDVLKEGVSDNPELQLFDFVTIVIVLFLNLPIQLVSLSAIAL